MAPSFPDTHWSAVVAAGSGANAALSEMCRTYWLPLYVFARQRQLSAADAQDAVQSFLADFIDRNDFARATPERGRFRSYLLVAFRNALANTRRRAAAAKRGGGLKIPWEYAEAQLVREADPAMSPEALYERHWALTVLERVDTRLAESYAGKESLLRALRPIVRGEPRGGGGYRELAADLGMSEGALKVAVHRMRRRYGEFLRQEVAATVVDPADIDSELRELIRAVSGPQL